MKQKKIKQSILFSVFLPLRTDLEIGWWRHIEKGGEWDPIGTPLDLAARTIAEASQGTRLGFRVKVLQDGVWFYSKGKGQPLHLAHLIQAFLKTFPSSERKNFALTWAETCNTLKPDAFGGGAILVTAQKLSPWTAWEWVAWNTEEEESSAPPEGTISDAAASRSAKSVRPPTRTKQPL